MVLKPLFVRNQLSAFPVLLLATMLLLADVEPIDTLKILAVCLFQIYAGAQLVERLFYRRTLNVFEKFGLGLPVGVAVSILFDLIFVRTAITQFAWAIPLVVIIAVCSFTKPLVIQTDLYNEPHDLQPFVWAAISLFTILGQEWFWPMPVAVFATLAALISFGYIGGAKNEKSRRRISGVLGALSLFALIFGVLVRPFSWWIEDSDFGFYEAFTISLAKWGTSENLLANGAGLRYHWFVYEWSGLVTKAASLSEWVMLSRGVIIIGTFSLVCLIWLILLRVTVAMKPAIYALLIVSFFDSVTSWGSGFRIGFISSPSQLVGFVWLFAILLVVLDQDVQRIRFSSLLYVALFSGAILSKISHGIVALGGLSTLLLIEVIRARRFLVPRLINTTAAAGATFFWFWHTYMGAENARFEFLKFPEEILGSLYMWVGKPLWLAAAILFLGLVGYQFMGLLVGLIDRQTRASTLFIFSFGAALAGLIVTLSIESLFGSQLYFLHSASSVVLLTTAVVTVQSLVKIKIEYQSRWRFVVVAIVGLSSSAVSWAIPTINSGSESAIWLSVSRSGTFVLPLLVAAVIVFPSSLHNLLRRYLAMGLVCLCALSIGFSMTNWVMVLKREYPSFDRNEQFNLGSPDLNSAMAWMRNSTPDETVFASNNESFLLSALSHRRGLLQAEEYVRRHTVLDENWSLELTSRRELVNRSFKSNSSMTTANLQRFKDFGVTTLVFDKSVPDFTIPDSSIGLPILYENETFAIFKIE
jgi:hypothetical protein